MSRVVWGICQGTIDRRSELDVVVVSVCGGCSQKLDRELPRGARGELARGLVRHPISQHGFSAFSLGGRDV